MSIEEDAEFSKSISICKVCNESAPPGTRSFLCRACKSTVHVACAKAGLTPMALPNADPGTGAHLYCEGGRSLCAECCNSAGACMEVCALPSKHTMKDICQVLIKLETKFRIRLSDQASVPRAAAAKAALSPAEVGLVGLSAEEKQATAWPPLPAPNQGMGEGGSNGGVGQNSRKKKKHSKTEKTIENPVSTDAKKKKRRKGSSPKSPSPPSTVRSEVREGTDCLFWRRGGCAFGDRCRNLHRQKCEKFSLFGLHQEKGCVLGPDCAFMHPVACRSALARGVCKKNACAAFHPSNTFFAACGSGPQEDFHWGAHPAIAARLPPPPHQWFNLHRPPPPLGPPPPPQWMPRPRPWPQHPPRRILLPGPRQPRAESR